MSAPTALVLAVVAGALFLEGVDIAMLNVAVPSIAADIGLTAGSAHWVITAYVVAYGGFMILGGRAADLVGRRRVFLSALALFVLFSVLGGIAHEAWVLVLVRFVTGASAGFMTPAGFSLLTSAVPEGPKRNRAMAIYGAIGASGFLLGVVAGGLLVSLGWRWVFFGPALLGLAFLLMGWRQLPSDRHRPDGPRPSFGSTAALLLTAAMVLAVYAIVALGERITDLSALAAGIVSVFLFITYTIVDRRSTQPLIPAKVLRTGLLPWTSAIGSLFMAAYFAWLFLLTMLLQQYDGWSPLITGLTFAAMAIELLIAPTLTPWLVNRLGNVAVMNLGSVAAVCAVALSLGLNDRSEVRDVLPALLLFGLAFALTYGPLTAASVEGVPESQHGVAGGIVYTGFQFGGAVGVAVATTVLVARGGAVPGLDDYRIALVVPLVAAGLAVVIGFIMMARRRRVVTGA